MELARRLADEVVELKANFLANMSHEIRTPMSAILGMVHLLGKTELNGRQLDYLRRIDIASKHLLGLLNAVLDFSKIEAGQLQVEAIKFDLPQLCEEVCTMLMADAEAKQLGLTLQVAPGLPRVLIGDPMRLSQIMINYVNNAIKFTERGQVAIRVEGTAQASGALALRVEVRDSGIGLTPEQCGRLFQSFVQAEGATTRRFGGTGLGLAISKGLAALMEGEVGVSSTPEVGSVFWFTALVQVPANAEPGVVAVPGQRPAPQLGLRSAMPFRDGQADVAIQDLWQRISAALGRNEFGVRELFVQNAPQLQSCLGPEYGTLWAAIDQFDFERARKLWHAIQL
jgi:two-component system sensor histidine kinase/response regulator